MQLNEAIYKRRTIREFIDKPIKREVINKILTNGIQAPSNSHMRTVFI